MNEPSMIVNFSTKNLVKIALALQLAMLGAIGLDFLDINIPFLRQCISFIYLSFVPGMLLLRVFKVHKPSAIETILYSVGLSLSLLMITGALISFLYPIFGISKPISEIPLVITISAVVLSLCSLAYLRDRDYKTSFSIRPEQLFSPPVLFSVLLPLLAVAGAYLLNFHDNNILLLILLGLVSIIPVLAAWNKVSKEIYPLIVWVTSIALLLHYTLLSPSVGIDAPSQVHYSNLVITSGFWNPQTPFTMYGKLSITMLIPLFSIIGEITPVWFLKVMYPLLLSLLPLGLYYIFRRQVSSDNNSDNNKIAFFSCFLFISTIHFIAFLSFGIRQGIAQIFLMLLILLMIDKTMQTAKRVILATIFAFSLIISHDSTPFIFLLSAVFVVFLLLIGKKIRDCFKIKSQLNDSGTRMITSTFITLYIVLGVSWHMYIAAGSMFVRIVGVGKYTLDVITELLNPHYAFVARISSVSPTWTLSTQILLIFNIIICLLITIGILSLFRKPEKLFNEYNALSLGFWGWFLVLAIPGFSTLAVDPGRLLLVLLLLLGPFCLSGGRIISEFLAKVFTIFLGKYTPYSHKDHFFKAFSVFLVLFLLLNSGFISEVIIKDYFIPALPISKERVMQSENAEMRLRLSLIYLRDYDVFSAQWLSKNREFYSKIYGSAGVYDAMYHYLTKPNEVVNFEVLKNNININEKAYVILTYTNNVEGFMLIAGYLRPAMWYNTSEIQPQLDKINRIYDNGGSVIYHSPKSK